VACCATAAIAEADVWANALVAERRRLAGELATIPGIEVVPDPQASFILLRTRAGRVREALRDNGFAVRRGDSFPGLGADWIRVAVRDRPTSAAFVAALQQLMSKELM